MPGNSFGTLFKITTFGESHGIALGVIIDGIPPNIELTQSDIQCELDRRRPGTSELVTQRKESDKVQILSGVFDGVTTGLPISLIVFNEDHNSFSYDNVKNLFRPGHADYSYFQKYGVRDYRGGGRSSGRETLSRVAAGAVAKKMLSLKGIFCKAYVRRAAGIECRKIDLEEIEKNEMRAPDSESARLMIERILQLKKEHNSAGGIVECIIKGVPPGLGEPVFDKINAELGKAMLSIPSVRGIEFGIGFKCVDLTGKENNDQMTSSGFITNNSGGILGGISSGEEIVFRIAVKPTPSISIEQKTINTNGDDSICKVEGRHDPCICPRMVPVVEAMAAITVTDHFLKQKTIGW
ncbi:MAG TPA: chorismate synthase [Lentisphaeria bacterium]|nr:MAG: chorismate synthase [Lentisphaerae bacterium GWF2_38_69]HBM15220.1 chorismate synthase [Lentisphaeria bacterium]